MNSRSFFLVASLQLITAFFVSVKIVQEIFISNPNLLTDLWISPPIFTLLAAAVFALIQKKAWFKIQPLFLAVSGFVAIIGASGVVGSFGGLQLWLLMLVALLLLLFFGIEMFLSDYLKRKSLILIGINLLFLAFLQIDWHVFFVTRAHLNFKILSVIWQDQALLLKAAKYLGVDSWQILGDCLLITILPLFLGLVLTLTSGKSDSSRIKPATLIVLTVLILVQYFLFYPLGQKTSLRDYISLRISAGLVPIPLHPDLAKSEKLKNVLNSEYFIDINKCFKPAKVEYSENSIEKIVLIGVESLRYDAFAELMPNTFEYAAKGKLFKQHYASSNISLSAFYSLLHCNFPVGLQFSDLRRQKSDFEKTAIENGFETVLIKPDLIGHAAPDVWGQKRIIEKSEFPWKTTPWALNKTIEQLESHGKSVILTYIFNTHFNYYFAPEFEKFTPVCPEDSNIFVMMPTPENVAMIRNRYKNAVHYLDFCLNEFFKQIKEKQLNEKTLFIVFGDHGQSLRENGCIGHGTGADIRQYRVPMFAVGPGQSAEMIEKPTSHFNALGNILKDAGFKIEAPFSSLDERFPVLALEESVSGRILVIQPDYINIFDMSSSQRLRWIAMVNRYFTLDPNLMKTYQSPDHLAETVKNDLEFLRNSIGLE